MFFKWSTVILASLLASFYGCSSIWAAAADEPVYLSRCNNEKGMLYADSLMVDGYEYDLKFSIDKTLAKEAYAYEPNVSHVLANGFDIYRDANSDVTCEYEQFTTGDFSGTNFYKNRSKYWWGWVDQEREDIGYSGEPVKYNPKDINSTNEDIAIDWMSFKSGYEQGVGEGKGEKERLGNKIYHKKSNSGRPLRTSHETNCGHSEPQLIVDIEDLLRTKPDSLIKLFTPRSNKKAQSVIMSGLELYGTFDACGAGCLDYLAAFRERHQLGQKSIAERIAVDLDLKGIEYERANLFVIIYHAYVPYVRYTARYEGKDYEFLWDIPDGPFKFQDFKALPGPKYPKLSQRSQQPVLKDTNVIYGHIHSVFDERPMKYKVGSYGGIYQ